MINVLFWSLGVITFLALCRFAPGFKCITWCRYRTIKRSVALKLLEGMCETYHDMNYGTKLVKTDFENVPTKVLVKIYDNTAPFGCKSVNEKAWIAEARLVLKERIAERHLLEL